MNITKRNHYNPCFWTALWNSDYYRRMVRGINTSSPRKQIVSALNVKSGQCVDAPTERVHYDKGLGIAEITREAAHDFAKRYHPDRYDEFARKDVDAPYPVYLDFENILTGLESLPPYRVLIEVAIKKKITTNEEKSFLASFVILQRLRSHAVMKSMIEMHQEMNQSKFEHFVTLKWMLGDQSFLFQAVLPLVLGQWFLYEADKNQFPLCDSGVLVSPGSLMVPLSPYLLLEINPEIHNEHNEMPSSQKITAEKFEEFRRRTIGNTFREIIGDRTLLEQWKKTPEFIARAALMKDQKTYNRMVAQESNSELWAINAFAHTGR